MKKIIIILALLSTPCFAEQKTGAFGISSKMTKDELAQKVNLRADKSSDANIYSSNQAPQKNPSFQFYEYYFSQSGNICKVKAYSEIVGNNQYGVRTKEHFTYIKNLLIEKYGVNKDTGKLADNMEPDYSENWERELLEDKIKLRATWIIPVDKRESNGGIEKINLETRGITTKISNLILTYEFENMAQCIDDNKKIEAKGL